MFIGSDGTKAFLMHKAPALGYALLIFFLSSIPSYSLPRLGIRFGDIVIHFIEFGIFGILVYRAFVQSNTPWKPYFAALLISIVYGALDEFHQYFVPGRIPSFADFAADSIGAMVCVFSYSRITSTKTTHRKQTR